MLGTIIDELPSYMSAFNARVTSQLGSADLNTKLCILCHTCTYQSAFNFAGSGMLELIIINGTEFE
jgi:hypothetical protein